MTLAEAQSSALAMVPADAAEKRATRRSLLLLAPALIFLAVFFAYPLFDMFGRSFEGPEGLTIAHYEAFATRTIYIRVLVITFQIALSVTLLCLAIGYPIAFVMANASPMVMRVMLVFILLPFFTSMLVRTYAWMVILSPKGVLVASIEAVGLGTPKLIYNRTGLLIGMVYTMLPYMVLTLFSIMKTIDQSLTAVAHSLGATAWQSFRRVYFPLSLPGVAGGSLLVFILSAGFYIVPRLMGGDRDQMLATIIAYQVDILLNWGFASAMAVILLAITLVLFGLYARFVGLRQLLASKF